MIERSDRINLPPGEARCTPSDPCHMRLRCARAQAAIPTNGAVMEDYSIRAQGGTALCPGYVDAASLRKQANPLPRVVHPPLGGRQ